VDGKRRGKEDTTTVSESPLMVETVHEAKADVASSLVAEEVAQEILPEPTPAMPASVLPSCRA